MSCKGTWNWLSGLFTGVAIGAAAGLLLAPKSGKETRAEINDGIHEKFYDAYDAVLNLGDRLSDQIEDLKADFSDWSEKVKASDLDTEEDLDLETMDDDTESAQMTDSEAEIADDAGAAVADVPEVLEEEANQIEEDKGEIREDKDVAEAGSSEKTEKK